VAAYGLLKYSPEDQDLELRRFALSLWARLVLATSFVDRCYHLFDRMRSRMVLACASENFYDIYNDLTYSQQGAYRTGAISFRSSLFPFEERAISRYFPAPPGTVLVGAAGGGREALVLARNGYRVVAFEPASALAIALARFSGELPIEVFVGRYEQLPLVSPLDCATVSIDLRSRAPFAAGILGWGSFSHLRSDEQCIETLKQFSGLTRGPILVSYNAAIGDPGPRFDWAIGYHRKFSSANIQEFAKRAALRILHFDDEDNWPHAVLQA
jgi:hypothetical protein